MQTLDHIAYNILNMIRAGRPEHNIHVDLRQIKEWIHQYRSFYIRRDLTRNRRYREFEQGATVPVSIVSQGLVRTAKLPPLIRLKDTEALTYAGSSDGVHSYQVVDHHSIPFRSFSKYTKNEEIVYVLDDRIYMKNTEAGVTDITFRGIFQNPSEFQDFLIDESLANEDDEWYYPLPKDMIESVVKNILQTEVNMELQAPLDTKTDTLPDEQVAQAQGGN